MAAQYTQPGRLGNEDMTLETDPRTNSKLMPTLKALGFTRNIPESKLSPTKSSMEEIKNLAAASEHMVEKLYKSMPSDLPGDATRPKVNRKDITIKGVDGNDVKLHVFREASTDAKKLPCVVYLHGGGLYTTI